MQYVVTLSGIGRGKRVLERFTFLYKEVHKEDLLGKLTVIKVSFYISIEVN